ncbi:YebC/PmpR family DNA-binding transcriptional regulator [Myxococcota bacterium]|nr:YebC/PmpR family DNA-binding transcriptional regulator [Myxococcota bacterium]MBU1432753.1 YebC/PmpR family DNA-binding transcriptional regulator [Myxococcota bacterium]MBU1898373.1 YebC/PmpR family DNA-binding transcriptional regulator [Myxococcota bacterium]
MSGHNKWSTIKHKKGRADAARGKLFTKLIRELTVATREGGKEAEGNARLRSAINAARGANMPNDTIDRAIKRGAGELDGESYEEIVYEGYGQAGVAFLVETMTTNRNRTVAEVRHIFTKYGGELGSSGSVAWMFEQKGYIEVAVEGVDFDALFEAAVEAGAEDVEPGDECFEVTCEFTDLHEVSKGLEGAGFNLLNAKPIRVATNPIQVEGSRAEHTLKLMGLLDDLDDVQNVWTNAEISEEEMERLSQ